MKPCILQVLEKLKIPLWYGLLELLLEKMGKLKLDITVCGLCGSNIPFKKFIIKMSMKGQKIKQLVEA